MENVAMEKDREERRLKYGEAREREIARQCKIIGVMDVWWQIL